MTTKQKIIANVAQVLLCIPAIAILNDNEDMWFVNFLGLAYAYAACKYARYFLPKWMIDYFNRPIDEGYSLDEPAD
jgi:hypothetical protein